MPPVIFNVELFLDRRYMGDVIGLFCVSACKFSNCCGKILTRAPRWAPIVPAETITECQGT